MSKVSVRQATTGDRDAIWEFIRHAYEIEKPGTAQYRIPARWIWQFERNPFINEEKDRLPIWLATVNDRIVGQYCAIPARVKIGKDFVDAAWGCDFIVDKDFRGCGVGSELHRALCDHYPVTLAITFAAATRHLWEKSGGLPLAQTRLYWYIVKVSRSFLYSWLDGYKNHSRFGKIVSIFMHPVPCGLLAVSLNQANRLVKLVRSLSGMKAWAEIYEILEFNKETDKLCDTAHEDLDIMVQRESKLLNWRIFANKQMDYHVFVSRRDGEVSGYVVLRKPNSVEQNVGTITDLYAAKNDPDTIGDLVEHSIKYFGKSVCAIQCLTSTKSMAAVLRSSGFLEMRQYQPLIVFSDKSLIERFKNIHQSDCYFTFIDHDIDKIRLM